MSTFGSRGGTGKASSSLSGRSSTPPARTGGYNAPPEGGKPRGEGRAQSTWTNATTLYDGWHSSLEVVIITDTFGSSVGIKLNPVFKGKAGDEISAPGDKKYNYDENVIAVLRLQQVIPLVEQLKLFMAGEVSSFIIPHGFDNSKTIVLERAESYYPQGHEAHHLHKGGLVFSIEQAATDRQDARAVVFISRPAKVQLVEETEVYLELEALLVVLNSYLGNVARVDYASMRGQAAAPASRGESATQPSRIGAGGGNGVPGRAVSADSGGGDVQGQIDSLLGGGEGGAGGGEQVSTISAAAAAAMLQDDDIPY